jgi:hypothetical protein
MQKNDRERPGRPPGDRGRGGNAAETDKTATITLPPIKRQCANHAHDGAAPPYRKLVPRLEAL